MFRPKCIGMLGLLLHIILFFILSYRRPSFFQHQALKDVEIISLLPIACKPKKVGFILSCDAINTCITTQIQRLSPIYLNISKINIDLNYLLLSLRPDSRKYFMLQNVLRINSKKFYSKDFVVREYYYPSSERPLFDSVIHPLLQPNSVLIQSNLSLIKILYDAHFDRNISYFYSSDYMTV